MKLTEQEILDFLPEKTALLSRTKAILDELPDTLEESIAEICRQIQKCEQSLAQVISSYPDKPSREKMRLSYHLKSLYEVLRELEERRF